MTSSEYYQQMRNLALNKRLEHKIETASLNLKVVRGIYKKEGIRIDNWDIKGHKVKAAYFCDDGDVSVLINKNLPMIPKLFALVHELKHHYVDQEAIRDGDLKCGGYNANELIEKGAEVFAAEFIYPQSEMIELTKIFGIENGNCTPEKIVEFKRTCPAKVSYRFITKSFVRLNFIKVEEVNKVQFQKLEESIYGLPIYKQAGFRLKRSLVAKKK